MYVRSSFTVVNSHSLWNKYSHNICQIIDLEYEGGAGANSNSVLGALAPIHPIEMLLFAPSCQTVTFYIQFKST